MKFKKFIRFFALLATSFSIFSSCSNSTLESTSEQNNNIVSSQEENNSEKNISTSSTEETVKNDHDGTDGLIFYPINDTECAVGAGTARLLKEIVIPSKYKNYTVTTIFGEYASSFEVIGGFAYCLNLEKITIPNSVTTIGTGAFYNCNSLKSITIPNSVNTIEQRAFFNCTSLTSVFIPSSVTTISYDAFNCDTLKIYCEVPSKPDGWDLSWVSDKCAVHWGVKSENIITYNGSQYLLINSNVFLTDYNGTDTDFVIPSKIQIDDIFYNVTTIGTNAFSSCPSLTSVFIPSSVTTISYNAFNCNSLIIYCEAPSKPDGWDLSWTSNKGAVHWGVKNLITNIEQNDIKYSIINGNATIIDYIGDKTNLLIIPSMIEVNGINCNVTTIGSYALKEALNIYIPSTITTIYENPFNTLVAVCVYCQIETKPSGWNLDIKSFNGSVYWAVEIDDIITKDDTQYLIKNNDAILTSYLGTEKKVDIPLSIDINNNKYNITTIGSYAFYSKRQLKSLVISNNVKSIESYAFYGCFSLVSVYIPNSVTTISSTAFYSLAQKANFYCEAESKPDGWAFGNSYKIFYWGLNSKNLIEQDNVQYLIINGNAVITRYIDYSITTSIIIPSTIIIENTTYNVTKIMKYAFYYHTSESLSILIPYSIKSIESDAFKGSKLFCEAESKPSGWSSSFASSCTSYWAGEWEYDTTGNPKPL